VALVLNPERTMPSAEREGAIAPEPQEQDVGLAQTSKQLSFQELKSKVNSIARTL